MNEPAVIRTTLRPFRLVFVVESIADVDRASEICDGALGGRLNLMIPAVSSDSDDVGQMLKAFDPDVIVAQTLNLPAPVKLLRLPTIRPTEAPGACFPLSLVSNLAKDADVNGVLATRPEAARHVRLNVGSRSDEELRTLKEQCPQLTVQQISTTADFLPTRPLARWCRLCGPIGLYNTVQFAGEGIREAEQIPKDRRTVIVSAVDDLKAICFFWNLRAFYPDADVVWLPPTEVGALPTTANLCWIWFESAGEVLPTAAPLLRPKGYFFGRYGDGLWSAYSSIQPASVGRRHLRVVHPSDRKPNTVGFDLNLCLQVEEFPDFTGPVSIASGLLFVGDHAESGGLTNYVRSGGGRLVRAVNQLRPGQNNPLTFEFRRPSPDELIGSLMAERGVNLEATPKSKLIPELVALVGGLEGASVLRDKRVIDQFVVMAPRRVERIAKAMQKGLTPGADAGELARVLRENVSQLEIVTAARPWPVNKVISQLGRDSAELVDHLCARRLLLPGKAFPCKHCDAPLWFPLAALGTATRCYCCNRDIRVPVVLDGAPLGDAVRLNELIANAIDQGSLPTLLVAHLLREQHFSAPRFVYDRDLFDRATSARLGEADLVFVLGSLLGLAEAKAARSFDEHQSERLLRVAETIRADIVIFATLLPGNHPELLEFEGALAKQDHRRPILLVTGDDIFKEKTFDIGALFRPLAKHGLVRASSLTRLEEWPAWARRWEQRYEPEAGQ